MTAKLNHYQIGTGARRGEALALTWDDVDFVSGTVNISKSASWVHGMRSVEPTKTNRARAVNVDPATVGALRAHTSRQPLRLRERKCHLIVKQTQF